MGCVVNGPGEARDADLGIAAGRGRGHLGGEGEGAQCHQRVEAESAGDPEAADSGVQVGGGTELDRVGRHREVRAEADTEERAG